MSHCARRPERPGRHRPRPLFGGPFALRCRAAETIRGGGDPTPDMACKPPTRMGPPPWSFAADAHGCIVVRIQRDRPNTSLWRDDPRPTASSPQIVSRRKVQITRRKSHTNAMSLTPYAPYKSGWMAPSSAGRRRWSPPDRHLSGDEIRRPAEPCPCRDEGVGEPEDAEAALATGTASITLGRPRPERPHAAAPCRPGENHRAGRTISHVGRGVCVSARDQRTASTHSPLSLRSTASAAALAEPSPLAWT